MFKRIAATVTIALGLTLMASPSWADNDPSVQPPVWHRATCVNHQAGGEGYTDHRHGSVDITWTAGFHDTLAVGGWPAVAVDPGTYSTFAPGAATVTAYDAEGVQVGQWTRGFWPARQCKVPAQPVARILGHCGRWRAVYRVRHIKSWQVAPRTRFEVDVNYQPKVRGDVLADHRRVHHGSFHHGHHVVQVWADNVLLTSRPFAC